MIVGGLLVILGINDNKIISGILNFIPIPSNLRYVVKKYREAKFMSISGFVCNYPCSMSCNKGFDRVGLLTNIGKTVSMVCHPCQVGSGNRAEEAYGRRFTGMGRSYAERQREKMECGECGEVLAVGSMSIHLMTRHGKSAARRQRWTPQADGGHRTYTMSFLAKGGPRRCPVTGCLGALAT